jgi:hypothetical protein
MNKLFTVLGLVLLVVAGAYAQDDSANGAEGENVDMSNVKPEDLQQELLQQLTVTSSPDIETHAVLPDYPDNRMPIGEVHEILVGVTNKGSKTFNITYMYGSFNYPQDPSIYLQNFTRFIYGMIVPPQSQVTFSYRFYPEANIEPRDYALMAAFDYEDEEGVQYTNTYHNGTVVMFEANSGFDFSGIFLYTMLLGAAGGGAYYFLQNVQAKRAARKANKTERGTSANVGDDFLQDTNLASFGKQKSPKASKKAKSQ